MLKVKPWPKVTLMRYYKQSKLNHISAPLKLPLHQCVFLLLYQTRHMTSGISLCGHVTHPLPLLPPIAPSNVETMATASWNQFVTRSLHFVWSVRQSSGAAVGENGAQASGASNFSKWGQAVDNHTATSCMTAVRPLASEKSERNPKLQ